MKNKIIVMICLISMTFLYSQELDPSFLNSLPEDIKKDLMEKNANQGLKAQENYKPYLYSSKLNQAEELIKLKERLESDLLELERRINTGNDLTIEDGLKFFGSDFFNTFQTSFMPTNEPNPDSDYYLDTGDVLNIQMVGQKDSVDDYIVDGSGSISLEDIGKVTVAGMSLGEASLLIKSKINSTYIGSDAFVGLSEIRDVNVLVTGNAENPGIYTLSGNSNILHAISVAGGVSDFGSYREINLVRNNKIIESLDVYDLLINGQYNLKKDLDQVM